MKPADRIATIEPYFFAKLRGRIEHLKNLGTDIIRLDMGSPDMPPAKFIVEALDNRANRPDTHGYTAYGGTPAYRTAVAKYYMDRFGVKLDYETNVVGLIGSKEGLFALSQVLINPGDIVLVPDPGYATYTSGGQIAGGEVISMPLKSKNDFLPDLNALPKDVAQKAKLIWLNYPNNPTGAIASRSFFEDVVIFAKRYDLVVAHDAPYMEVCYDGYLAPSLLQIPGAMDVSIEFNSLSKTYNMAGWRLGMAVGNADLIGYLKTYKSQIDSSHFEPCLYAGIAAMTGDQGWIKERNLVYQERRDRVVHGLKAMNLNPYLPKAALYVWTPLPDGVNDMEFCERMLSEIGVSTTPGSVYGEHGKGFFRISLSASMNQIEEALHRLKNWI